MKPCIINGEDTIKIAKRLRKRCLKKQNKLESLLNMKFTSTVKSDEIKNISNFPKLTISQLKNHIVLGSYKIKLSLSYMGQLVDHGKVYFLNKNLIDKHVSHSKVRNEIESNNSKILAVLIRDVERYSVSIRIVSFKLIWPILDTLFYYSDTKKVSDNIFFYFSLSFVVYVFT